MDKPDPVPSPAGSQTRLRRTIRSIWATIKRNNRKVFFWTAVALWGFGLNVALQLGLFDDTPRFWLFCCLYMPLLVLIWLGWTHERWRKWYGQLPSRSRMAITVTLMILIPTGGWQCWVFAFSKDPTKQYRTQHAGGTPERQTVDLNELERRYPYGYTLFRPEGTRTKVLQTFKSQKSFQIDWDKVSIHKRSPLTVTLVLPVFKMSFEEEPDKTIKDVQLIGGVVPGIAGNYSMSNTTGFKSILLAGKFTLDLKGQGSEMAMFQKNPDGWVGTNYMGLLRSYLPGATKPDYDWRTKLADVFSLVFEVIDDHPIRPIYVLGVREIDFSSGRTKDGPPRAVGFD